MYAPGTFSLHVKGSSLYKHRPLKWEGLVRIICKATKLALVASSQKQFISRSSIGYTKRQPPKDKWAMNYRAKWVNESILFRQVILRTPN